MALKLLHPHHGVKESYFKLAAAGFTQLNYDVAFTNNLLTTMSPRGVLGGSVAGLTGAGTVGKATSGVAPVGFYINDAEGYPYENTPAIASGINTFYHGPGLLGTDIYETHTVAGALQTYAAGDNLYTSVRGLITKEANGGTGGNATLVGVVADLPTPAAPFLVFFSRLM